MSRDPARDLPILTDVVELHATGSFPKQERAPEPEAPYAAGLLSSGAAGFASRLGAASTGIVVMYVGGLLQLAVLTGGLGRAAVLGVLPFVALDLVKAVVAALVAPTRAAGQARA